VEQVDEVSEQEESLYYDPPQLKEPQKEWHEVP
jgi:hypothetical protein